MSERNLTTIERQWFAGYFDAGVCLYLGIEYNDRKSGKEFFVRLRLQDSFMQYPHKSQILQNLLGGEIRERPNRNNFSDGPSTDYVWRLRGHQVFDLLELISGFLVVRRSRVHDVLQLTKITDREEQVRQAIKLRNKPYEELEEEQLQAKIMNRLTLPYLAGMYDNSGSCNSGGEYSLTIRNYNLLEVLLATYGGTHQTGNSKNRLYLEWRIDKEGSQQFLQDIAPYSCTIVQNSLVV